MKLSRATGSRGSAVALSTVLDATSNFDRHCLELHRLQASGVTIGAQHLSCDQVKQLGSGMRLLYLLSGPRLLGDFEQCCAIVSNLMHIFEKRPIRETDCSNLLAFTGLAQFRFCPPACREICAPKISDKRGMVWRACNNSLQFAACAPQPKKL